MCATADSEVSEVFSHSFSPSSAARHASPPLVGPRWKGVAILKILKQYTMVMMKQASAVRRMSVHHSSQTANRTAHW